MKERKKQQKKSVRSFMFTDQSIYNLVVWRDLSINLIDFIEALMFSCGHSFEQACQCILITYTHGKCAVKIGDFFKLSKISDHFNQKGINCTIELKEI
ncbi:MAG: hypothetical protein QM528_00945 [Phycisphaerales bacterium]|nr:hypothetical protein [Phycisphaerales bacterium]